MPEDPKQRTAPASHPEDQKSLHVGQAWRGGQGPVSCPVALPHSWLVCRLRPTQSQQTMPAQLPHGPPPLPHVLASLPGSFPLTLHPPRRELGLHPSRNDSGSHPGILSYQPSGQASPSLSASGPAPVRWGATGQGEASTTGTGRGKQACHRREPPGPQACWATSAALQSLSEGPDGVLSILIRAICSVAAIKKVLLNEQMHVGRALAALGCFKYYVCRVRVNKPDF